MRPLLTIGIPTFERRDEVLKTYREIVGSAVLQLAEVVFLDDGSRDGTAEALRAAVHQPGIRVVASPDNGGYAGAFASLFDLCETEYLLLSTDDDRLRREDIVRLVRLLERRRPAFVSTRFPGLHSVQRGGPTDRPIRLEELRSACSHAPGLVYHVPSSRPYVGVLRERLARGCNAAMVYPQMVVVAHLLINRGGWWSREAPVEERAALPSGIRDQHGETYTSVASRWRQLRDFDEVLESAVHSAIGETERERARRLLEMHRREVFGRLRYAIHREHPQFATAFDAAAARSALRFPFRRLRALSSRWWERG